MATVRVEHRRGALGTLGVAALGLVWAVGEMRCTALWIAAGAGTHGLLLLGLWSVPGILLLWNALGQGAGRERLQAG